MIKVNELNELGKLLIHLDRHRIEAHLGLVLTDKEYLWLIQGFRVQCEVLSGSLEGTLGEEMELINRGIVKWILDDREMDKRDRELEKKMDEARGV